MYSYNLDHAIYVIMRAFKVKRADIDYKQKALF